MLFQIEHFFLILFSQRTNDNLPASNTSKSFVMIQVVPIVYSSEFPDEKHSVTEN